MDTERTFWSAAWSEQLQTVFKYLLDLDFNIPDDSVLHILQDKIKNILVNDELIQTSQLEWFITSVLDKRASLNTPVISFAASLVGWLAETEEKFNKYGKVVEMFLSTVQLDASLLQEFSVATSVYESLSKICRHVGGLTLVLKELKGFVLRSYNQLNTGSSVFVDRAIVEFLATSWTNSSKWSVKSTLLNEFCEDNLDQISQRLAAYTPRSKNERNNLLTSLLQLLVEVCKRDDTICSLIMSQQQLYQSFEDLVLNGAGINSKITVDLLKVFLLKSTEDNITSKIERFTLVLYNEGNVKKAQELTLSFLKRSSKPSTLVSRLLEPITQVLTDTDSCGNIAVTTDSNKLHILCHCISCLERAELPVVTEIVRIFKTTCDLDPASQTQKVLMNSSKLQKTCLNYFHKLITNGRLDHSTSQEIIVGLSKIIRSTSVEHQTYAVSLMCLLPLFPTLLASTEVELGDIVRELSDTLQCHLCAVEWEVRDTTLEFLCQVLEKYKDNSAAVEWLISSHLHIHAWKCLLDQESYVRATAVTFVSKMLPIPTIWQSLMKEMQMSETQLIEEILKILHTDTEAFPRRATVKFIYTVYNHKNKLGESVDNSVMKATTSSINDFDWEVKLEVLELIQSVITHETEHFSEFEEDNIPKYAAGLVKQSELSDSSSVETKVAEVIYQLHTMGCWVALFTAIRDYDLVVCKKANDILSDFSCVKLKIIRKHCNERKLSDACELVNNRFSKCYQNGTTLETADSLKCIGVTTSFSCAAARENEEVTPVHLIEGKDSNGSLTMTEGKTEILEMMEKLLSFKPELNNSVENNYDTNPFSLLEDILSYARKNDDSNIVDCY